MNGESSKKLKRIFGDALECPLSERTSFLDSACRGDLDLRRRVDGMLADFEAAEGFMSAPTRAGQPVARTNGPGRAVGVAESNPEHEKAGTMIGRYKLLQLIGEGGFGAVYMAEQREPVKRKVALKIIKLGMDTKQVIARFEAERQALAMMDHPNIARVLDAGATENGRPYFVMELVRGVPITEYCDRENLTPRQRLELFMQVCNAVQHAHQKGIIHRDIKPSNVMLTLHDGVPVPKVIDFGIAKATNAELTEKTLFTRYEQMIGTPAYMSPEQAEMSGLDIDTRSDIYGLGVLLYELLTGTTPFDATELRHAGYAEIQRIIREVEPPRPSTRVSALMLAGPKGHSDKATEDIARHRRTDPQSLSRQLRGDLDWIVMKCLEKDRTRRYETANGLAADIQRHLSDEPVDAGPPSAAYRLRKFVKRNRGQVIAGGVVAAALLLGIAGTTWGLIGERKAKQAELEQRLVAEEKTIEAQDNLKLAREQEHKANASRDEAQKQTRRAEKAQAEAQTQRDAAHRQSYVANIVAAQASIEAGEIKTARVRLEQAPAELRGWEWKSLHTQLDQSLAVLTGHTGGVFSVAFSPDGSRIALGGERIGRLWDAASGEELLVLRGHEGRVTSVAFSPDGSRIATGGSGGGDNTVRLWDAASGEQLHVLGGHEGWITSVAFAPGGSRIASGGRFTVSLWDVSSGEQLRVLRGHEGIVTSVAFSPDGSRIASGAKDGRVRLWDVSSGQELAVLSGHEWEQVWSVAFSPDGSRIVSGSGSYPPGGDNIVRVWDAASREELLVLRRHEGVVRSVAFSPDGSRIATGSGDKTVRLWDAASGEELVNLRGHESGVNSVAFSPDGSRIASGAWDGTVRLWDAARGEELLVLRGNEEQVYSASFSPDGRRIASGSNNRTVRLWDTASRQELAVLRGHEDDVFSVAFSPDGSRIASGSSDKTVRLWDVDTGEQLLVLHLHDESVNSVVFSPDGSRIASGSGDRYNWGASKVNTVRLWDANTGEQLLVLRGHERPVVSVAFSPEGSRIASGAMDSTLRLWDAASGEELLVLRGENWVTSVAFSPDGSRIASGGGFTVRLWDVSSGEELVVFGRHEGQVRSIAFSPDGSRIASGTSDTVRLWDASSGQELRVLRGHEQPVTSVAFSPDGSRIVSASWDATVRLWDTVPYRDRIAERDQGRRDGETIRPFVEKLFREGLDCSVVAERVRADASLSDPLRHAAINLVLKRCSAIHEQAHSLVNDLEKQFVYAADIQAAVKAAAASLEPTVRAAANHMAHLIEDSPDELFRRAGRIIDDDERSRADYEQAQRAVTTAFDSRPTNLDFAKRLVKAWTRLHQPEKAVEVWREHVEKLRDTPPDDWRWTSALIEYGKALMKNDRAKEAEPLLRECLSFQINKGWNKGWNELFKEARRLLAECLTKLARFTEAEPLLIDSANALLGNDKTSEDRKAEAVQRVVDLYEAWHATQPDKGYDAQAEQWRARLPKKK